jgi:predicted amidohydrolase YtcJ
MDGDRGQFDLLQALERNNQLSLKILLPLRVRPHSTEDEIREIFSWRALSPESKLRPGFIKFLLDGIVESATAHLIEPYAHPAGLTVGDLYPPNLFEQMATFVDSLGLQVAVHAIGDGAVNRALSTFENLRHRNGSRDRRSRIEHIELLQDADLPRFAANGIIASMQPLHAPVSQPDLSNDAWAKSLGAQRLGLAYRWRDLLESGTHLTFGSDWPVVSYNPLLGVQAAVTRCYWPQSRNSQKIELADALRAYSSAASYAEFREQVKGKLLPGYEADLVLLDGDIFESDPNDIANLKARLTVVDGEIVHGAQDLDRYVVRN